jgi:SAM-dependent methyltransferase
MPAPGSRYDPFASVYDQWSSDMTEDVPFYVELAREVDGPSSSSPLAAGRVAIPVALETGRRVIGIDLSPAMLAQARVRAEQTGADLELREQDMRDLSLDEPAALVYCPYRALLHLPTWRDKRRVFERVAASLRPGGRFAWNAFCFDHRVAARLDGTQQDQSGIEHELRFVPADNRLDITAALPGGPHTISLWWTTRSEWEALIDVAGLEVEALYGWFDRRPFDDRAAVRVGARKPGGVELRRDRAALRPVEPERRRGRRVLRRGSQRVARARSSSSRRHGTDRRARRGRASPSSASTPRGHARRLP